MKHQSLWVFNLSITFFRYLQYGQWGVKYLINLKVVLSSWTFLGNYWSLIRLEFGIYHSSAIVKATITKMMTMKLILLIFYCVNILDNWSNDDLDGNMQIIIQAAISLRMSSKEVLSDWVNLLNIRKMSLLR